MNRFAVLLSCCLMLAGCVGARLETPHLTVAGVELLKGDLLQQNLRVRLHVVNPNRVALPVRAINYEVELAGERFAHGETERDFTVPARGEADFDVAVTANGAGAVLKLLTGGSRGGGIDYLIRGRVELRSTLWRTLPFEQRGRIDLRQMLERG